ncbi:MAG: chromosome segregation protein SMC [Verrucomicrobia bacterium]|nr:chromosome segregation protein SMC [Verrucomicrobiota bacterium]
MYFKRLEVIGFKSFANKTVIEFEPGVTAIVGPNGCGKSNVSDAIRWVLGEQNPRDLRGKQMEDVIFNGTADEKPMGMAEVSLVMSNAGRLLDVDFEEVRITRRLFRSGESQYLLNKQPCRLKDIQDLLMGTGVGLDAYSHFEQGEIEQLLSAKPEDRRHVFEEAAGILKYKADRKAALRKLEATEENLVRINDIIREVKRQINTLDRQAAKARRHRRLSDELVRYDCAQLLHNRDVFAAELTRLTTEHDRSRSGLRELYTEIETRDGEIDELRAKLAAHEREFEALQTRKLELLRAIDHERNTITLSEQRIADGRNAEVAARGQIESLQRQIDELGRQVEEGTCLLQQQETELRNAEQALIAQEERVAAEAAALGQEEAAVADAARRALELVHREIKITNEIEALDRRLDEAGAASATLHAEQEQLEARRQQLDADQQRRAHDQDELAAEARRGREEEAALRESLQNVAGLLNQDMARRQRLSRELAEVRSQYDLLVEMRANYEGYHHGVKSILRAAAAEMGALPGIYGTAADLLRVPEEFEIAIEAALGGRLQYIAVATGRDAERAIAHLKETGNGRATFLPYDLLRPPAVNAELLHELFERNTGLIAAASEVVGCDERDRVLVAMLLGDTVLVEDFDAALRIAEQKRFPFRLVTRAGEVFSGRGVISGGRAGRPEQGLLSRDTRIAQLEEKAHRLQAEHDTTHGQEQDRAREAGTLEIRREEIARRIRAVDEQLAEQAHELARVTAGREAVEQQLTAVAERLVALEDDATRLSARREEVRIAAAALDQEKRAADEETARRNEAIAQRQAEAAEAHRRLTELKVQVSSLKERTTAAHGRQERTADDIRRRNEEIVACRRQIEAGQGNSERLALEMEEARRRIEEVTQQKAEAERAIEALDERRAEIGNRLGTLEAGLKDKRRTLHDRQEAESGLNAQLTEARVAVERIDERLRNEYKLTHDNPAAERFPPDSNWEEVAARVEELRAKIESLGPVNIYAIEEYERLEERHTFLVKEQEDLINAKESLLKAIAKINRTSRELFRETFNKIRDSFREMFTTLFGGGKADLILDDESDILECGIEIVASPPGKKLQSITLMSGGEKAMTAICLLFSIFRVKPSPFCILDEMDAALDEPNILRFNDTLKEFLLRSQFIIITHNKRTIAMADVLYGITMERSGISKVVSVKFRDALPPAEPAAVEPPAETES